MKKTSLQIIALFCIELILLLPIYSAVVFADIIRIQAKGTDGINNYIRQKDFISFIATVEISGDNDITPNQVRIEQPPPSVEFDACTQNPNTGYFECTERLPPREDLNFLGLAPFSYTIGLRDDNGNTVGSPKSDTLYIDNLNPVITSFQPQNNIFSEGEIEFQYTIEDTACNDNECLGKCSGIKKIEFSTDGENFQESANIDTASCTASGSLRKDSNTFTEGENAVYARAFDKLNNPSDVVSAIFEIDTTTPAILANTFRVTDSTDLEINYVAQNNVGVSAEVEIVADDLDKDSVFGDFSALKPGAQGNVKAVCGDTVDSITTCTWDIKINANEAGTKNIKLEVSDLAGNKETVTIPRDFDLDDKGPNVVSLRSSKTQDGNNYVKNTGNSFIAEFIEDVGIKKEDVLLHVGSIVIQATNCTSSWTCTWENIAVSETSTVKVSIQGDTKDRLGNSVASDFSIDAIVDIEAPKVSNITITNAGGATGVIQNFTKTGDSLQIVAFVEDEGLKDAFADLSRFIIDATDVSADLCLNTEEDNWVCFWTTTPIDMPGFIENKVIFTFVDVAGNSIQHEEQITVFGLAEEVEVDLWQHKVSCSPKLIDRETTSLISQRVFCHVTLEPILQQDIDPLVMGLGECAGNTEAIEAIELVNAEVGSRNPFIKINLKQDEFRVDNISFVCPLGIISRIGNQITQAPETENVQIKLEFYNLPLGEISDNLQRDIDDAIDDATKTLWKIVGTLKKILFYSEKICQLNNIWANIVTTYHLITQIFDKAAIATGDASNPIGATLRAETIGSCISTEVAKASQNAGWKSLNKFCGFVNCKMAPGEKSDEWSNKWQGYLGGYGGFRQSFEENFPLLPEIKQYLGKDPFSYMNVKDSIVMSTLFVCVPGIVHNLDKYRQIQCMYANCLQEGVAKQGLPKTACDDQKDYATCKYVVGEVFKVIPPAALFNYYINLIRSTLTNPFTIIGAAIGLGCEKLCPNAREGPHTACVTVKIFSMLGETIEDVKNIIDGGFEIREDFCDRLDLGGGEE